MTMGAASGWAAGQVPGTGWVMSPSEEGEIGTLYWELYERSEVWVRLEPRLQNGQPAPLNVIVYATFEGRQPRRPVDVVTVEAQPGPLTIVTELSFELLLDGASRLSLDTMGAQWIYPFNCDAGCSANGVRKRLGIDGLRRVACAGDVTGRVLGFDVHFTAGQLDALRRLIARVRMTDPEHACAGGRPAARAEGPLAFDGRLARPAAAGSHPGLLDLAA